MATINQFYRWNIPDRHGAFYPEVNRQTSYMSAISVYLQAQSWTSNSLVSVISQIRSYLNSTYNNKEMGGNFVAERYGANIDPADPTPTSYFLRVYNPETYSYHSGQYIEIEFVVSSGIISTWVIFDNSYPTAYTSNALPFRPAIETDAVNAMNASMSIGYGEFPKSYRLNTYTGVAISNLARAKALTNSSDYVCPVRTGSLSPIEPTYIIDFQTQLSSDEQYIVRLIWDIIERGFYLYSVGQQPTIAELIGYVNSTITPILPVGWTADIYTSGYFVEITFTSALTDLKLIGQFDGTNPWSFQRFYKDVNYTTPYLIDNFFSDLPFEPNYGNTYLNYWFDLETIKFPELDQQGLAEYPLPVKSGDLIQFTSPVELMNLFGKTGVQFGVMDCDGLVVAKRIRLIDIYTPFLTYTFKAEVFNAGTAEKDLDWFVTTIYNDPLWDENLTIYIGSTTYGSASIATIPKSSIDVSTTQTFVDSICNYSGYNSDIVSVTGYTIDNGQRAVFEFVIGYPNSGAYTSNHEDSVIMECVVDGSGYNISDESIIRPSETSPQISPDQYCNSVIETLTLPKYYNLVIPSLSQGIYHLFAYKETEETCDIFAISNQIKHDDSDGFSTIIEYWDDDRTINAGLDERLVWNGTTINPRTTRLRIGLNGGGAKPKIEESIYRQSDGIFKRPINKLDYTLDLHTDFFDEPTQRAMVDATRHQNFIWNGKAVFFNGDIEVATIQDFSTQSSFEPLAQMKMQVLIQGYQPTNSDCAC
jgi:hypothetical protein